MNTDETRLNDAMHNLREIAVNLTMKGAYDSAKTILTFLESLKDFAPTLDVLGDDVRKLALAGKKVDAIKLLREQRGMGKTATYLGLKEAKDLVEAFMASKGLSY